MRFTFFILLIAGLIVFAIYKITNRDTGPRKSFIASAISSVVGSSPDEGKPSTPGKLPPSIVPGRSGQTISENVAVTVDQKEAETISGTYTFKHRPPPEGLNSATPDSSLYIITDSYTRTVHITGRALPVSDFLRYLADIDRVGGSCAVQTWAVYVDKKVQRGWDLVAAINSIVPTTTATIGNGGFTLDVGADKIGLALTMIADGASVEVLQRPHVRLEHGFQSRIESIQEVPVPTTTASQGIAQTSIDYRKVGLQLSVTPYFLDRGRVQLNVSQSNGLIGQNVRIDGNEVPVIQSQTVSTMATVNVGQTVILGGVSTRRETLTRGLLRNTKELTEGALYVILSTFYDEPKAIRVSDLDLSAPFKGVPLTLDMPQPADWIDGELLPKRGVITLPK